MQVTNRWLRMSRAASQEAIRGVADLKAYNADFAEWGDGPPIVLVPGLAGGISLVEPFAIELARNFHVIALELRGERDCFALRQSFGLNDLADDVAEFVSWRGLERPSIVGVSFGGVVALNCAARYTRLFSAIGVQGVGLTFESGLLQRVASMVLSHYPLPENCSFVNQFFGLLFGKRPAPDLLAHVTKTCWQTDQSIMAHRLSLLRRLNFEKLLHRIVAPTIVLSGRRDAIVSEQNARQLVDGLLDCRHSILARAGHLIPLSHTEEMATTLGTFIGASVV